MVKFCSVAVVLLMSAWGVTASAEELVLRVVHRSSVQAMVSGSEQEQACRTLKSARGWLSTRWPKDHRESAAAPDFLRVLEGVRKRLVFLDESSRSVPKTTFSKLASFTAEKECLNRDALVRPAPKRRDLERERFLLEKVFCQDDGKGGFFHAHEFECVTLR